MVSQLQLHSLASDCKQLYCKQRATRREGRRKRKFASSSSSPRIMGFVSRGCIAVCQKSDGECSRWVPRLSMPLSYVYRHLYLIREKQLKTTLSFTMVTCIQIIKFNTKSIENYKINNVTAYTIRNQEWYTQDVISKHTKDLQKTTNGKTSTALVLLDHRNIQTHHKKQVHSEFKTSISRGLNCGSDKN